MDSTDHFANEVRDFRDWLMDGDDEGEAAALAAFILLSRLLAAALALPGLEFETPEIDAADVSEDEWKDAYAAAGRLPVDLYRHFHDPSPDGLEEPTVGSLSDDLADVYRDVVRGLRAYEQKDVEAAIWEWRFNFAHHWGAHATAAIRVLQSWLQANAFSLLYRPLADADEP